MSTGTKVLTVLIIGQQRHMPPGSIPSR